MYEYEGIDKDISKRTVQMDIQMMPSEKLGYIAHQEMLNAYSHISIALTILDSRKTKS